MTRPCMVLIEGMILIGVLSLLGSAVEARPLSQTRHNLSASGPGTVKTLSEKSMCHFCHSPHRVGQSRPLWNKDLPEIIYTTYRSSSLKAAVGQPNGVSKLCLSCHDGTIALVQKPGGKKGLDYAEGVMRMPTGRSNLGTDLSDDHPVSFLYDNTLAMKNGQLEHPLGLRRSVRLDAFGQLQCTSCHNPHDDQYGKFLAVGNEFSALCTACHKKTGWQGSVHQMSNANWNGVAPDPWPHTSYATVSSNGCENCHRPHTAGGGERLLNYATEEQNCFPCHNGDVASKKVQREFTKPSRHPIETTRGVHEAVEDPLWAPRHVECVDCHNPHAANASPASPPQASGSLAQVAGISSSGATVIPLVYEYQLCYRCHGDNPGSRPPVVARVIYERNLRQKFKASNMSYHPVEVVGKNPDIPSLLVPYTTSSLIYCTDCHNSDSGPKAGGAGPNGPHGSMWTPILERQAATSDFTTESPQAYALCYKCHNRNSILSDQSFSKHRLHIVDKQTPCTACHDPHGTAMSTHLINFDRTIVFSNNQGILRFEDRGRYMGACYLKCHNINHNLKTYP